MDKYRIIIAGGRDFEDYDSLKKHMTECLSTVSDIIDGKEIVIVSGTAKGADSLGERFAEEYGYAIEKFPANWDAYGKRAGIIRNIAMADHADALIAFWNGSSRGTANMIATATRKILHLFPVYYYRSR